MHVRYILHALGLLLNSQFSLESALWFSHGCVRQGCYIHGRHGKGQDDQLKMSDFGRGKMPLYKEEVRMAICYREDDPW